LVGWLVGWLVGRSVGRLVGYSFHVLLHGDSLCVIWLIDAKQQLKILPPSHRSQGFIEYDTLAPKLRSLAEALPAVATTSSPLANGTTWGLSFLLPFVTAAGILKRTSPEVWRGVAELRTRCV